MESILESSRRTASKIAKRLKLACFTCGWDKDSCDFHHIIHQANGGTDNHENLTYICPNCHRLAHSGKLTEFKTFKEVVGDEWKKYYNITPVKRQTRTFSGKRMLNASSKEIMDNARKVRGDKVKQRAKIAIERFILSGIDTTKYGWKQKASEILEITPQKVKKYFETHAPHLLIGAQMRSLQNQRMKENTELQTVVNDYLGKNLR